MARARDRYDRTEYGGGEGSLPTFPDGGQVDLKKIAPRTGDAARVLRTVGHNPTHVGGGLETNEAQVAAAEDIETKTNGYGDNAGSYGELQ